MNGSRLSTATRHVPRGARTLPLSERAKEPTRCASEASTKLPCGGDWGAPLGAWLRAWVPDPAY